MISSMSRAACTARRKFDVVRRRLRMVELDHLEGERQHLVDDVALVASSRLAVGPSTVSISCTSPASRRRCGRRLPA